MISWEENDVLGMVDDATLDINPDRPIRLKDLSNNIFISFNCLETFFVDPIEAKKQYQHIFRIVREHTGDEDSSKITVKNIKDNARDIQKWITQNYIIHVELWNWYIIDGNLGELKTEEQVKEIFVTKNAGEKSEQFGISGLKNNPENSFACLFGWVFGGWRHNVKENLQNFLAWVWLNKDINENVFPLKVIKPSDVSLSSVDYLRVSLLFQDPKYGKTILRTDVDSGLIQAMNEKLKIFSDSINHILTTKKDVCDDQSSIVDVMAKKWWNIHALVAKPEISSLERALTATFNAESRELGQILSSLENKIRLSIENTSIGDSEKKSIKNRREEILYIRWELLKNEEQLQLLKDHMKLAKKIQELYSSSFVKNDREISNKNFSETNIQRLNAQEKELKKKREEYIRSALGYIAREMNDENHILITDGENGMLGCVSTYKNRIIMGIDVLRSSQEVDSFLDMLSKISWGSIDKKNADTTGAGDSCNTAWVASNFTYSKKQRERIYFQLLKDFINPKDYNIACSLAEAFWRSVFVKVLSGVIYRCEDPNLEHISSKVSRIIVAFVNRKTRDFIQNWALDALLNTEDKQINTVISEKYSDSLFWFQCSAVIPGENDDSLNKLCYLLEINRDAINRRSNIIANFRKGEFIVEESLRDQVEVIRAQAKEELILEKWGRKTHEYA